MYICMYVCNENISTTHCFVDVNSSLPLLFHLNFMSVALSGKLPVHAARFKNTPGCISCLYSHHPDPPSPSPPLPTPPPRPHPAPIHPPHPTHPETALEGDLGVEFQVLVLWCLGIRVLVCVL